MNSQNRSLYHLYQQSAGLFPHHTAFITPPAANVTYSDFLATVDRLAAGLASHGIHKGDRLCVLAFNTVETIELMIACAKLGVIFVPVNWRLSVGEISQMVGLTEPVALVTDSAHLPQLAQINLENIQLCVCLDRPAEHFIPFGELLSKTPTPDASADGSDPLAIIATAAVAGVSRGSILTHTNFLSLGEQIQENFNLSSSDRFLAVLPFFHIAGLNMLAGLALAGGACVILPAFDPAACSRSIDEYRISLIVTFPPMLETMLDQRLSQSANWESLRFCFGILNPPEIIQRCLTETNAQYWTGYGQTETTGIVTLVNVVKKPGSAGKVVPALEMRCVNDLGEEVQTGEPGEIVVRGSLVHDGYWQDQDYTWITMRDGWHHTGDVGRMDQEGYLYYLGRTPEKELIKSGGENIYPAELEKVILKMPEVYKVCVIGVQDDKWGEAVKAVIQLKKGATLAADQVIHQVSSQLAGYKKPRHVLFVDTLPVTASGEIDRALVKKQYN